MVMIPGSKNPFRRRFRMRPITITATTALTMLALTSAVTTQHSITVLICGALTVASTTSVVTSFSQISPLAVIRPRTTLTLLYHGTPSPLWNEGDGRTIESSPMASSITTPNEKKSLFPSSPPTVTSDFKNSNSLLSYQKRAQDIASSFSLRPFRTLPIFSNPHFQTITGALLRNIPVCHYWNPRSLFLSSSTDSSGATRWMGWDRRERISTPDGDFFDVDFKFVGAGVRRAEGWKGTVVMTHGFESNSESPLCADMAVSFLSRGFDVICINFRGCSGEPNLTLGGYHLGFTDDLKYLLMILRERGVTKEGNMYLSGFSLGSNVVLKLLGELGEDAMDVYNIRGCAVIAAPLDVSKHYIQIEKPGINSAVYASNLLKTAIPKARLQHDRFKGNVPFNITKVEAATTIAEIETHYVAPIYGFRDNFDYYEQVSCGQFLKGVAVPTLIINAKDDPFFDPTVTHEGVVPYDPVRYVCTENGGHLGYMFHVGEEGGSEDEEVGRITWVSNELGRFLEHVDGYTE